MGDLLAVNSVVKTSQMQDAVHRGVLDGAYYVPAYWYSKAASASLFGTGPCWGWSAQELLGWVHCCVNEKVEKVLAKYDYFHYYWEPKIIINYCCTHRCHV